MMPNTSLADLKTTARMTGDVLGPRESARQGRPQRHMDGRELRLLSRFMESSAVEFLDRLSVEPGSSFLDVACGSGQVGLIAARRGANVTGVDIAANAIGIASSRTLADRLPAHFDEGDAEALPYADARFDVVASLFGVMFAPRFDRDANELLRVCGRGGTVAMGNWTKSGFIGQTFQTFARFIAPVGMPAPVLWGDEDVVRRRFGSGVSDLRLARVVYRFDYPFAPTDVVEFFRQNYGPTTRAFAALAQDEQAARVSSTCGRRTTKPKDPAARSSMRSTSKS
jgi:SAM-dependent methyltransferase